MLLHEVASGTGCPVATPKKRHRPSNDMGYPTGPFMLASMLLATVFAGCTDSDLAGDSEGTWFVTKGIQCRAMPWDEWAQQSGRAETGREAQEPFTYDERKSQLMAAYYAETDPAVQGTWAFYDDRVYPSVCGAANAWNYWVLSPHPPGEDWQASSQTPQEAADARGSS